MTPPDGYSHALPLPATRRPGPRQRPRVTDPRVAERLQARRRRVAAIRKRVVTIAAIVFVALWALIFVQLVSGHDPALTRSKATKAATASTSASSSGSTGSSASNTASSSSASSGTTSPVTTSQS